MVEVFDGDESPKDASPVKTPIMTAVSIGFATISDLVEWLLTLDFDTMAELCEDLLGD